MGLLLPEQHPEWSGAAERSGAPEVPGSDRVGERALLLGAGLAGGALRGRRHRARAQPRLRRVPRPRGRRSRRQSLLPPAGVLDGDLPRPVAARRRRAARIARRTARRRRSALPPRPHRARAPRRPRRGLPLAGALARHPRHGGRGRRRRGMGGASSRTARHRGVGRARSPGAQAGMVERRGARPAAVGDRRPRRGVARSRRTLVVPHRRLGAARARRAMDARQRLPRRPATTAWRRRSSACAAWSSTASPTGPAATRSPRAPSRRGPAAPTPAAEGAVVAALVALGAEGTLDLEALPVVEIAADRITVRWSDGVVDVVPADGVRA